jgi:hypothetical protein
MATTQRPQDKASTQGDSPQDEVHPVIVVSVDSDGGKRRSRKKKKGSSKASRRLTDIENRATDSLHRVTRAVNRGVVTYREKRDASERKRQDGALVDFWVNAATGVSKAVADSAPVLTDLAKAFTTNRRRKQFRKLVRSIPVLF